MVRLHGGDMCPDVALPGAPFPICYFHAKRAHGFVQEQINQGTANIYGHMCTKPLVAERIVYYLRIDGCVKIGTSGNLKKRLRQYPPTTQVLAVEPGDENLESQRHAEFARYLVAGHEWFAPAPDLLAHIQSLRQRHGVPDSVGSLGPVGDLPDPISPVLLDSLLTTADAAQLAGVSTDAIKMWRRRGHLTVSGLDERKRPLYRWIDVLRAEMATRNRAGRKSAA